MARERTATFKEVTRIPVNESRDITISTVTEGGQLKGWNVTDFVRTHRYTGYGKGGVFIPVENRDDFLEKLHGVLTK